MGKKKEEIKIFNKHGHLHTFESIDEYQKFIRENAGLFLESYEDYLEQEKSVQEQVKVLSKPDMVNHPPHYANRTYEVIDIMKDTQTRERHMGYLEGSVIKYVMRWDKKESALDDLEKAQWYLNKLIQNIKEETACCGS
jgi:hypothetical protein